jgi:hypothetical protein
MEPVTWVAATARRACDWRALDKATTPDGGEPDSSTVIDVPLGAPLGAGNVTEVVV